MIRLKGHDDRAVASVSLWVGPTEKGYMNEKNYFTMEGKREIYLRKFFLNSCYIIKSCSFHYLKNCFPLNKVLNTTTHSVLFCGNLKYQHFVIKFISLVILKKCVFKTANLQIFIFVYLGLDTVKIVWLKVTDEHDVDWNINLNKCSFSKQINWTFYFGKIK